VGGFGHDTLNKRRKTKMSNDGWANFFLGLGLGVGIGMLFAPKSGEETRGLLKSKADEGTEYLKKQAAESTEYLRKQAADLRESAGGVANDLLDKGRQAIGHQREVLNDAIDAGKQAYREMVEPAAHNRAV
jgi:gas vesicle protein